LPSNTSAIIAIALDEPEGDLFSRFIASQRCVIGWPTLLEVHLILRRLVNDSVNEYLLMFIARHQINVQSFTQELFEQSCKAFDQYGKGRHLAKLNFGDCMAYAVAKANGIPLLFKGDDFARTDIEPAIR
jgi:ribonuclease VapC